MEDIAEIRAQVESAAILGAKHLKKAKEENDTYWIGYWSCYIDDRERLIEWLDERADR